MGSAKTGARMSQAQSFYENHSFHEGLTWLSVRERIGQGLRERYRIPKELPPRLQTLVLKVDAIEGNQLLSYSARSSDREQIIDARRVGGIKAFPDWFMLT
jgi:hypothetical protein